MADKKISELTAATTLTDSDLWIMEQGGTAKKVTGKTMVAFMQDLSEAHGGIKTIAKTATSGLIDTYTITLSDGSTTTFAVTNGKSLSSIAKSGTSGLVDSYKATYNDGTTQTFQVTNGRGISKFAKSATSGLTDTYTMTYNDGTSSTFSVANGKGVSKISKTATSGLVDTYTITYNDGSTDTFTVTNGKAGAVQTVGGLSPDSETGELDIGLTIVDGLLCAVYEEA